MKIRLFTLPNMLTLGNLVAGVLALIVTLTEHDYMMALWLIIIAAVFDFFDGFAARLLKQQSPLGVQLDSGGFGSCTLWPQSIWHYVRVVNVHPL